MQDPDRSAFEGRFATYVGELREVFARGELQFGHPKDIAAVAQALSAHGTVREDAEAVVRSLLSREGAGFSRAELTSVLVVAAGGSDLYGSAQEGTAMRQIGAFADAVWLAAHGDATAKSTEGVSSGQEASSEALRAQEAFYFVQTKPEVRVEADTGEGASGIGGYRTWGWVAGACLAAILMVAGLAWRHHTAGVEHNARSVSAGADRVIPPIEGGAQRGLSAANDGLPAGTSDAAGKVPGKGATTVSPGSNALAPLRPPDTPSVAVAPTAAAQDTGAEKQQAVAPPEQRSPAAATQTAAPKPKGAAGVASIPVTGVHVSPAVGGRYVVSSGVMSGHLISAPQPAYPKMAKMWGIEGEVILQAVVSKSGQVVATHVLDGHKMLRGSATNAVKKWRYRPYVVDGKPTDIATVVIVDYKLKP